MTYKQAEELDAQVRKGEHGSLVVFADRLTKTETNDQGEEIEREIPFMKGYTVFNVEQIDGLPAHYYAKPEPKGEPLQLIENAEASSPPPAPPSATAETAPITPPVPTSSSFRRPKRSRTRKAIARQRRTS